jgi:hypothetical protein
MELEIATLEALGAWEVLEYDSETMPNVIPSTWAFKYKRFLDGLIKNESDIQPDTLHGDTHAQSAPVFGLAYLLGINLMPRIRNLKKLVFFKPDRSVRYEHINGLFSEAVNWYNSWKKCERKEHSANPSYKAKCFSCLNKYNFNWKDLGSGENKVVKMYGFNKREINKKGTLQVVYTF